MHSSLKTNKIHARGGPGEEDTTVKYWTLRVRREAVDIIRARDNVLVV